MNSDRSSADQTRSDQTQSAQAITPTFIGHVIGASFGLVFVLVNSAPVATAVRVTLCILAVAAFLVVIAAFIKTVRIGGRGERADANLGFNGRYWLIVGGEAILLFGGITIVRLIEPAASLGWIALVVGVHFFPLARLWAAGRAQLVGIAIAMTVLGIVGIVIAFTTHNADVVALVSGVGSGIVLLGSITFVAVRTLTWRPVPR